MEKLFSLEITVAQEDADALRGELSLEAEDGWQEAIELDGSETYVFTVYVKSKEAGQRLKKVLSDLFAHCTIRLCEVEQTDWLLSFKTHFQPVLCGSRFAVLPPWEKQEPFGSRTCVIIEPKNAFGTGQHETTALCLSFLSSLLDAKKVSAKTRFLDLGTGSGILAIAATKEGLTGLGLDIDADSVENAKENAALNQETIPFELGSLEKVAHKQFDLIFANILANPLIEMAKDLAEKLLPGGYLILSGMLTTQAQDVASAYQAHNVNVVAKEERGEWEALLLQKRA